MDEVKIKLGGPRQIDAADWMMGKPTPEEINEDGLEWEMLGASVRDGVLTIPAHLLADFIEEVEDGIIVTLDSGAGTPEDMVDARAVVRAMEAIITKLKAVAS